MIADHLVELAGRVGLGERLVVLGVSLDLGGMAVVKLIHPGFVGFVERPEGLGLRFGQIHIRADDRLAVRARGRDIQLALRLAGLELVCAAAG